MTLKYLLIIDFPKFDPVTAAGMALCVNLGSKCQNLFPLVSDCSARDWERSGLLEENPQSGCSDICASLKGPL